MRKMPSPPNLRIWLGTMSHLWLHEANQGFCLLECMTLLVAEKWEPFESIWTAIEFVSHTAFA